MSAAIRPNQIQDAERPVPAGAKAGAFTVLELLGTLAIIAILTAIGLPAIGGARNHLAVARTRAELAVLGQSLEEYRRHYGDYPQTGAFPQADPATFHALETGHAQTKLLNALMGGFGPRLLANGPGINGRSFVAIEKFSLEFPLAGDSPAPLIPRAEKKEARTCLLDSWGRRYLYYYKSADDPGAWLAASYVLYSAGPDGLEVPPDPRTGRYSPNSGAFSLNADNIHPGGAIP